MSGKLQFRERLSGILELGNEKNKVLTTEEVEQYFEEEYLLWDMRKKAGQ